MVLSRLAGTVFAQILLLSATLLIAAVTDPTLPYGLPETG